MADAGDSVPGAWDGFSVLAEVTALGVRATGFRYTGDAPGQPMLMGSDAVQTITDLRLASPGPNGEMFDVYLARLNRTTGEIVDQAFSSETGAGYRVTAPNVGRIAALARPGLPFLPPSPAAPAPPPEQVEAEVVAAAQPQPEVEGEIASDLVGSAPDAAETTEISPEESAEIAAAAQPQPEVEASMAPPTPPPAFAPPAPPAFAPPAPPAFAPPAP
ncbi:MAG: hypothetical protein JWM76_1495, partial [Pseudonocardiales bacterium]|nr:hypothetical protein [Pseudonocardiales bacterium]